jgi:hypothetical protein
MNFLVEGAVEALRRRSETRDGIFEDDPTVRELGIGRDGLSIGCGTLAAGAERPLAFSAHGGS